MRAIYFFIHNCKQGFNRANKAIRNTNKYTACILDTHTPLLIFFKSFAEG